MARRRSSRRRSRKRSSRRPRRRSTKRRRARRRSTRRSSRSRSGRAPARRTGSGRLRWQHVKASLVRRGDPLLRGRIRLDRGAGVLEFPTPDQFKKIAREEGVPDDVFDRAFGHLVKRRRRSGKKKRRSSRRNKGSLGALLASWLG